MKMEQIECSETSAYIIQTPGNYPKENIIYIMYIYHMWYEVNFIPPAYEDGTDRVFRNVGIYN